jgi:hypothetical protein
MADKSLAEGLEFPARAVSRYTTSNKLHVQTTIQVSSQLLAMLDPTQLSNGPVCFAFTRLLPSHAKNNKDIEVWRPFKNQKPDGQENPT